MNASSFRFMPPIYDAAITQWVVKRLKEMELTETHFSRSAGLGKGETDARTFRKIKEGKRKWSLTDICKAALFFETTPAKLLKKVEQFIDDRNLQGFNMNTGHLVAAGLAHARKPGRPLISSWVKKGREFLLACCDPQWNRATGGELLTLSGTSASRLFPKNPDIITALSEAWDKQGVVTASIHYTLASKMEKRVIAKEDETIPVALEAVFVPPDQVVLYATPGSKEKL